MNIKSTLVEMAVEIEPGRALVSNTKSSRYCNLIMLCICLDQLVCILFRYKK